MNSRSNTAYRPRPVAGAPASGAAAPILSRRFKDAFKLALSMVIATGIALSLNWEKPYWAALAVFMCSFTAGGDSLAKGLLRIAGTAVAVVVTLTLVALAPQERWVFLGLITGWVLLCGYMLTGAPQGYLWNRGYFWMYAGFTVPILATSGGVHAVSSFETVIWRAQETGLGVLVYSLVSFLIWPVSGSGPLKTAIGTVVDAERRAIDYMMNLMAGLPEDGTADKLRAQAMPILGRLPAMLDGAALDSAAVRDQRDAWRRLVADLGALTEAIVRWHSSLADVSKLDLKSLLPGLTAFGAEVDRRLLAVQRMLQGQASGNSPAVADVGLDAARLNVLALFDRAALIVCTDQMRRVDRLTESLFTNMAAATGAGETPESPVVTSAGSPSWMFDPDRFLYAMRAFIVVWAACLLAIFVPGLPGVPIFIGVGTAVCLGIANMPQVPPTVTLAPVVRSLTFAGALYVLVLPRLSGFTELAIVLFLVVFAIGYRFPADKAPLDRPLWLSMLVLTLAVSNEQSYSFLHWANLILPLVLAIWLISLTGYFPISYQARDRYLRLLRRFFRSCRFLVSPSQWTGESDLSQATGYRARFHTSEVARIPSKMLAFCGAVQARLGSDAAPTAQGVVGTLQGLSRRLVEVRAARAEIGSYTRALPEGLQNELAGWRVALHELFERLSVDPEALRDADLAGQLDAKVRHLEASVEMAINAGDRGGASTADELHLYRLLAALRDISVSLVRFQQQAAAFDWDRLRESRF